MNHRSMAMGHKKAAFYLPQQYASDCAKHVSLNCDEIINAFRKMTHIVTAIQNFVTHMTQVYA